MKIYLLIATAIFALTFLSQNAHSFYRFDRTDNTERTPNREIGEAVTITWTIVEDGTAIIPTYVEDGFRAQSDWISTMDETHNVPNAQRTDDLTNRVWFQQMELGLSYISAKARVNFVYVDYDDGSLLNISDSIVGTPGVRADLRVGGANLNGSTISIGGHSTSNNEGGISSVIMNSRFPAYSNPVAVRGVFMHEVGHALGFGHSFAASSGGNTMMGYNAEGPQFDEIYALQQNYGDIYEGATNNDSIDVSYNLGRIDDGTSPDHPTSLSIGTDIQAGGAYRKMTATQNDIASIDDDRDTDFYEFFVRRTANINIALDPRGPNPYDFSFNNPNNPANTAKPLRNSNLSFSVFDTSENLIMTVDETRNGLGEAIDLQLTRGEYYIRVNGSVDNRNVSEEFFSQNDVDSGTGRAQFYSLKLTAAESPVSTDPVPTNPVNPNPVEPNSEYTHCAEEGQVCRLPGLAAIRYGANGRYVERVFIGGNVNCNNEVFSDPIRGTVKSCEYRTLSTDPNSELFHCAEENQVCRLPGPAAIRYGANGQYVERVFIGGNVNCTNEVFSDPIRGTVKSCEYRNISTGIDTSPTSVGLPAAANPEIVPGSTGDVVVPDFVDSSVDISELAIQPDSIASGPVITTGGSMGWLSLLLIAAVGFYRRIRVTVATGS